MVLVVTPSLSISCLLKFAFKHMVLEGKKAHCSLRNHFCWETNLSSSYLLNFVKDITASFENRGL